ncbi:MOSC domain-containing protein [Fodinicola acaciae]|uniref:MOSC domain-containing protein n=1 Tax=Fodinicola acaciae TaxID=2681555 RepID=UPI0013D6ABC0|nr:MOSC N-terminal beta barrel domain-containing protein [Fodinicola acaciae]
MIVGRVVGMWRYPVKSMAGEPLEAAEVSWHGLAGDRRWAFVRDGQVASNFPWLTIRQLPDMTRYQPKLVDPQRPEASATVVRTPAGRELDVTDPALCKELGDGVRVMKQNRGIFDTAPLSLMTTQSVENIGKLAGARLRPERFRPNVVIEATGDEPFQEDGWVGHTVRIGGIEMHVDQRDSRCVLINYDPHTAERNPAVLKAVAKERDNYLGVYGAPTREGVIRVGDEVHLDPAGRMEDLSAG